MSFSEALGMGEFRPNTKVDFGKIVEVRSTRGAFVAFEGADGVGKSTQVKLAADWVKTRGWEVVTTREPGGTNLGRQLRALLLDSGENADLSRNQDAVPHAGESTPRAAADRPRSEASLDAGEAELHGGQVAPRAEALLFAADRAQHVAELIVPALNAGKVVISDRFMASSVAYQGQGRDLGPKEIRDLSLWATGGLTPNLTVLLDLDPEIAWERQQNDETRVAPDRMEGEGLEFQRKVRAQFRRLAEGNETWLVVDASLPPEEIAAQVRLRLATILPVMKSW